MNPTSEEAQLETFALGARVRGTTLPEASVTLLTVTVKVSEVSPVTVRVHRVTANAGPHLRYRALAEAVVRRDQCRGGSHRLGELHADDLLVGRTNGHQRRRLGVIHRIAVVGELDRRQILAAGAHSSVTT